MRMNEFPPGRRVCVIAVLSRFKICNEIIVSTAPWDLAVLDDMNEYPFKSKNKKKRNSRLTRCLGDSLPREPRPDYGPNVR